MKKNMIALAVAGALVAPVAMAEVTISGGLQAELVQIGGDGAQPNGLYAADAFQVGKENSGNYGFLKFSASEDLGGGMKALAVYNMNTHVGDESNAVGTRDAYVGLSTGLGTILAGTLNTPYKSSTVGYDPLLMTSFQARGNYGMSGLHNGYVGNAVAYANSFAGGMVSVVAALVLDEAKANDSTGAADDKTVGKHGKSISVNVKPISGLDVALAWIDVTDWGNANYKVAGASQNDVSATKIGAKYTMGAFSVAAQHEMIGKGMTVTDEKGAVSFVTGTFNINDANSISVSYGKTDKDAAAYQVSAASLTTDEVYAWNSDATYMAVGFKHAFSKNTSATVGYRVSDAEFDRYNATTDVNTAGAIKAKETAIGAGLRVAF